MPSARAPEMASRRSRNGGTSANANPDQAMRVTARMHARSSARRTAFPPIKDVFLRDRFHHPCLHARIDLRSRAHRLAPALIILGKTKHGARHSDSRCLVRLLAGDEALDGRSQRDPGL